MLKNFLEARRESVVCLSWKPPSLVCYRRVEYALNAFGAHIRHASVRNMRVPIYNTKYEGDPRSNANSCLISFTIAIVQDSLHQNNDALSNFPDPIAISTESHSNRRCLATRECKVNDLGHC